jgi:hypothetical protein
MYLLSVSALSMYCEEPGGEHRALMVANNPPGRLPSFETCKIPRRSNFSYPSQKVYPLQVLSYCSDNFSALQGVTANFRAC